MAVTSEALGKMNNLVNAFIYWVDTTQYCTLCTEDIRWGQFIPELKMFLFAWAHSAIE